MQGNESEGSGTVSGINPYSPLVPESRWEAKPSAGTEWEPKASIWERMIGVFSCLVALHCLALTGIFIVGVLADAAVGNFTATWGRSLVLTLLMLVFGILWSVAGVYWLRGRPPLAAALQGASMLLLTQIIALLV